MKHLILFIVVFNLISQPRISAQNVTETLGFADQLYQEGRASEAVEAYLRVAWFNRMNNSPSLLARIADCYYLSGDLEKAIEYYDHSFFFRNQ